MVHRIHVYTVVLKHFQHLGCLGCLNAHHFHYPMNIPLAMPEMPMNIP